MEQQTSFSELQNRIESEAFYANVIKERDLLILELLSTVQQQQQLLEQLKKNDEQPES